MDNAQAVNMREAFKYLAEETPNLLSILVQVATDEISQCLKILACTLKGLKMRAYPFLAIFHRNV